MNVQKRNDVTIYNLSTGPMLPEWLGDRARRNLSKRDESIRRRIELIQDFQMPSSSSKVVQSHGDGRYIVVGGTYPPRIRCYDIHDLTLKFERYLDSHIVDIVMLGEDYGKMAILQDDRTISFHAHYGAHEKVRIPKFGRGMAYESTTCELLIAGGGSQIYRLNLEEGRFSEPWSIEKSLSKSSSEPDCSCISVSPAQPLAAVGCDDGVVRFFDNRSPDLLKPFLKLDVQAVTKGMGFFDGRNSSTSYCRNPFDITSVAHDTSGLYMAAGTAGGLVALYDVRSSKPLHVKEHKHGLPIHTLKFHPGSGCLLSSDEKLIKIWKYRSTGDLVNNNTVDDSFSGNATTDSSDQFSNSNNKGLGAVVANVESSGKFSNFIMGGDEKDPTGNRSGLLLCTTDQPKLEAYYIPKVGLAPSWCSFLENITEELEERDLKRDTGTVGASGDTLVRDGQETVFENYKFVSHDDLEKLGVSDLIGTPLLKAYMHGFFMDNNLYNKVRAVANPFEYEEYRKKKIKERLEAKRASRIAPKASNKIKQTSVNPDLAGRLQNKAQSGTKAGKAAKAILSDDRFGNLFENKDYEVDEMDENFLMRNPSGVAAAAIKRKKNDDMDSDEDDDNEIDAVSEGENDSDDEDNDVQGDDDESDSDDDDGFRGGKVRGENYDELKQMKRNKKPEKKNLGRKSKRPVMYEADDLGETGNAALHAGLVENSAQKKLKEKVRRMNIPLEERFRLKEEEEPVVKITAKSGSKEITYIPKDSKSKKRSKSTEDNESEERSTRNRRGVKELGFRRSS
jgi:ribosome biogenesis protein ENP2